MHVPHTVSPVETIFKNMIWKAPKGKNAPDEAFLREAGGSNYNAEMVNIDRSDRQLANAHFSWEPWKEIANT